jgi:hypothetical protein
MNIEDAASAFLILLPIAFNAFFFLLARLFDYPDILRSPTEGILSRFQAGGVRLKLVWYGFMLTAILLTPLAVLLGQVLAFCRGREMSHEMSHEVKLRRCPWKCDRDLDCSR